MTGYQAISLVTSTLTPIAILILGYWFNRRLKQLDNAYHQQSELDREEKEQKRAEIERRYKPHIEFTMDANFAGPQKGKYVAEFVIYAHNKSLVRHEFKSIPFRVLGIKKNEELMIWGQHSPRLEFPHEIIDSDQTDLVPWNFIFVEPGVIQQIHLATPISDEYAYIVAHAVFHYDKYTPHVIERVFALPAHEPND
ncbi:MAG: hypothetical protein JAZ12_05830 [Candidatus Thiodiazotropha taylori]|nr:hypothetical protein [Candidatus Thiodiazotropha taylori]